MEEWDRLYTKEGEIQSGTAKIIEESLILLKERKVKRVLDLGFGTGRHTIWLAEKGFEVYGIDISRKGKEITEKKIKERNLKNVYLKTADMHDIPFDKDFFDAVIATYVLEHNTLSDLKKAISEVYRVTKPKGIIIATLISTGDPRFGKGKKIEPNTYIDLDGPSESNVPHHFSDKEEIERLFSKFNTIQLKEKRGFSERRKTEAVHWEIMTEKL